MDKVLNMQSTKDFILDKIAYWALSHKTDQKDGFLADADIPFPEKNNKKNEGVQPKKPLSDILNISWYDIKSMLALLLLAAVFSAVAYGVVGHYTGHFEQDNGCFFTAPGEGHYHSTKNCIKIKDKSNVKSYSGRTEYSMKKDGFTPCVLCTPRFNSSYKYIKDYTLECIFAVTTFLPMIIYFLVTCVNWKLLKSKGAVAYLLILLISYSVSGIIYFSTCDDYFLFGKKMDEWLALYILAPLIPVVFYFIFTKIKPQKALSEEKVIKRKKRMRFWKKFGLSLIALFIPSAIQTALKTSGITLGALPTVILFTPSTILLCKMWKDKKAEEDQPAENDK